MKLPNIGLIGKTRSGKDEIYKTLESMGFNVERIAFGDTMKEHFFKCFPHIPKEPKPIELLQQYGQAMREIDEDVWVKPVMEYIRQQKKLRKVMGLEVPAFVFTDIRQPNEYKTVASMENTVLIKVKSSLENRVERMKALGETPTKEVLEAPTEKIIDKLDADIVLFNNGSLKQLRKQVEKLVYFL